MTRLGKWGIGLVAALLVLSWPKFPAHAQAAPQCNDREVVLELLSEKYSEAPVAVGVANNGGLVEVLSTADGDTWSIIITSPKGMSCLVAAGEGWRPLERISTDPEA